MSSSGWGGPGTGPQGEPWQNGAPHDGRPGPPPPDGTPPQAGSPYGAPPPNGDSPPAAPGGSNPTGGAWGPPGPQGPGSPQGPGAAQGSGWGPGGPQHSGWGPGAPQGPGSPQGPIGPQGPGGAPPGRNRAWLLTGIALTCVLAMLVVVGGGITYLVLRQGDETPIATDSPTASETTPTDPESPSDDATTGEETTPAQEESDFEVTTAYDPPTGTPDELWAVLENNPLTHGTLPQVGECELPATPIEPTKEELQAVLDAAGGCLNRMWATASSDRGLPWVSPKIVVYEHPDVPAEAGCDSHFSADFPRMCNLDSTLYWPLGYGTGRELSDPADVPGAYLWDLAYLYTNPVDWHSSVAFYYLTMRDQLETTDEERFVEAWRRESLQDQCLAAAMSMQVPDAAQPSQALRSALTDPSRWTEGEPPETIDSDIRVSWIQAGFESEGDLAACNTWAADPEQVN